MLKRYENKIAFITGSSIGIGFGIAKRMAQEGATVIISSRKEKNVEQAVTKLKNEGLSAVGFPCHVGKKDQRKKLYDFIKEKFGRLDILVLNAAISLQFGSPLETTEQIWDKTMDVNLKSVFFSILELKPLMPAGNYFFNK